MFRIGRTALSGWWYANDDSSGGMAMWMVLSIVSVVCVVLVAALLWWRSRNTPSQLISIVMLRSAPLEIEPGMLKQMARTAYNKDFETISPPSVHGETLTALVSPEMPCPISVIAAPMPYSGREKMEPILAQMEHPDLREAVGKHTSWVGVDAHLPQGTHLGADERAAMYQLLARLVVPLTDDKCLMLYLPEEKKFLTATAENLEALMRQDAAVLNDDPDELNAPIIQIAGNDAAMERAKRKAAERLPEFLAACQTRLEEAKSIAKVGLPLDEADTNKREFIWFEVTGVRQAGAGTVVEGKIINRPIRPDVPAKGQPVRVPSDRIIDWLYIDADGKPQGGFVEKVLRKG